jgi:hypothetical protein
MTLKSMFNSFCAERGVTMRSLRLTYRDKRVFLSGMKNETPKQLGMLKDRENSVFVLVKSDKARIDSVSVRPQDKQQRGKTKKRSKGVGSASKVKKERIKTRCVYRGLQDVAFDDPHEAT